MSKNKNWPGYLYGGFADPETDLGILSSDDKVYFETFTPGVYLHMDNLVVNMNEYCHLMYDGSNWSKVVLYNSLYVNSIPIAKITLGFIYPFYNFSTQELSLIVKPRTYATVIGANSVFLPIKAGKYPIPWRNYTEDGHIIGFSKQTGDLVITNQDLLNVDWRESFIDNPFQDDIIVFAKLLNYHGKCFMFPVIESPCVAAGNNMIGYYTYPQPDQGVWSLSSRISQKGNAFDLRTICPTIEEQLDGGWGYFGHIENSLIDDADTNTKPVKNPGRYKYYLTCIRAVGKYRFKHFIGENGRPVIIDSSEASDSFDLGRTETYALYNNGTFWKAVRLQGIDELELYYVGFYSTIHVTEGTYLVNSSSRGDLFRDFAVIGDNMPRCRIVTVSGFYGFTGPALKNLTVFNFGYYGTGLYPMGAFNSHYEADSVWFKTTSIVDKAVDHQGNLLVESRVVNSFHSNASVSIRNCIYENRRTVEYIDFNATGFVEVIGCQFKGSAYHVIRIALPLNGANIFNNSLDGAFVTGFFIGSNRSFPLENIRIEDNKLTGIIEEGIAFDGFGNNQGSAANMTTGFIVCCTNDPTTQLLKVSVKMHDFDGNPINLSNSDDWTKFYFTFNQETGRDGLICKIISYETIEHAPEQPGGDPTYENILTLDTKLAAGTFQTGGKCGIQSGFFNCTIRNNILYFGGYCGHGWKEICAISMFLNCFNFVVENNMIYGFPVGISLYASRTFGWLDTLTFHNIIRGNKIFGAELPLRLTYPNAGTDWMLPQSGNIVENNMIEGGKVAIFIQKNLRFINNQLSENTELIMAGIYSDPPTKADEGQVVLHFELDSVDTYFEDFIIMAPKVINIKPQVIKMISGVPTAVDI